MLMHIFSVSFRHVKRYIMEQQYEVLTPDDVIEALTYEGGVKATFVDYIKVHRGRRIYSEFEMANKAGL